MNNSTNNNGLKTFAQLCASKIEPDSKGDIKVKLTEADIKALQTIEKASNTKVNDTTIPAGSILNTVGASIAAALEGQSRMESGIVANKIVLTDQSGTILATLPSAACKVSNILTDQIQQANVYKLYVYLEHEMDGDIKGTVRKSIRQNVSSPIVAQQIIDFKDGITKTMSDRNFQLSCTLLRGDVLDQTDFEQISKIQQDLAHTITAKFLMSRRGADEQTLVSAYKNINRSYIEYRFREWFEGVYGDLDWSNEQMVVQFHDFRKQFWKALNSLIKRDKTAGTVTFGLHARTMTITPSPNWRNVNKLARVHQFGHDANVGSYYVSDDLDDGMSTIPITDDLYTEYRDVMVDIVKKAAHLIENRVRQSIDSSYPKVDYKSDQIRKFEVYADSFQYKDLLGITEDQENMIINSFESTVDEALGNIDLALRDRRILNAGGGSRV